MDGAFLDWGACDVFGYVAADELYEGPTCASAVDNRQYNGFSMRSSITIPNHDDITVFLGR